MIVLSERGGLELGDRRNVIPNWNIMRGIFVLDLKREDASEPRFEGTALPTGFERSRHRHAHSYIIDGA